jgi:hypothetical protein
VSHPHYATTTIDPACDLCAVAKAFAPLTRGEIPMINTRIHTPSARFGRPDFRHAEALGAVEVRWEEFAGGQPVDLFIIEGITSPWPNEQERKVSLASMGREDATALRDALTAALGWGGRELPAIV